MIIKGCTTKQAYLSYDDALAHLKSLVWFNACRRQERLSKGLNIYRCDSCDRWHVGHRQPQLVWHYTTGQHAQLICADGFMRPWGWTRKAARRLWNDRGAARLYDRVPLLWFSRNQIYEPTARKGLATPAGVIWLTGSQTEVYGSGLFRFGVDAAVVPLRWYDHLELNHVPRRAARIMERQGYPPDWLASRRPIPLSRCHAIELFYQHEWRALCDVSRAQFDAYLAERRREEALAQHAAGQSVAVATVRRAADRVGRNEVCTCGSGRKFKRCCGATANALCEQVASR